MHFRTLRRNFLAPAILTAAVFTVAAALALRLLVVAPDHVSASCFNSTGYWTGSAGSGSTVYHLLSYSATGDCVGNKLQVYYTFHQSASNTMSMYQRARDWECGSLAFSYEPTSYSTNNSTGDYSWPGYCGFQADTNASWTYSYTTWHYWNY